MPQLRHALAESGINTGQSSVGGESTRNGSSRRNSRLPTAGRSSYAEHHGGDGAAAEGVSAPAALQRMASAVNGVDIFA